MNHKNIEVRKSQTKKKCNLKKTKWQRPKNKKNCGLKKC